MNLRHLLKEYFKYCVIGALMTALDFIILAFEVEILKTYYLLAAMISYAFCAILHYIFCVRFIFIDSHKKENFRNFSVFLILGILGLCLYEFLMWLFVDFGHLHYLIAKVFATAFSFTFNFISRKFILFR